MLQVAKRREVRRQRCAVLDWRSTRCGARAWWRRCWAAWPRCRKLWYALCTAELFLLQQAGVAVSAQRVTSCSNVALHGWIAEYLGTLWGQDGASP